VNGIEFDGLNLATVDGGAARTYIDYRYELLHGRNWAHNCELVHLHAVPLFLPYVG